MDYGRLPSPMELHLVSDSARAAAALVIRVASDKVSEASLPYQGDNGNYFLQNAESVTYATGLDAAETVVEMVRPDFTKNVFFGVQDGDDANAEPLELSPAGTHLVGERAERIRSMARGIGAGALAGEHVVQAVKFLDRDGIDTSPMVLEVHVARGGNGNEEPLTTVDFSFTRLYDGDDKLTQRYRIEHNPNTDEIRTGSAITGQVREEDLSTYDPATNEVDYKYVPDPTPQESAEIQQQRFRPCMSVDHILTDSQWLSLLNSALDPADRLQHAWA